MGDGLRRERAWKSTLRLWAGPIAVCVIGAGALVAVYGWEGGFARCVGACLLLGGPLLIGRVYDLVKRRVPPWKDAPAVVLFLAVCLSYTVSVVTGAEPSAVARLTVLAVSLGAGIVALDWVFKSRPPRS